VNERERLKFCLARELWPKRNELCPNEQKKEIKVAGRKKEIRYRPTWGERFREMHGESLEEYRERLRSEQANGRSHK
jgi:hypothetical protein